MIKFTLPAVARILTLAGLCCATLAAPRVLANSYGDHVVNGDCNIDWKAVYPLPKVNQEMFNYAWNNVGKQIGDGQCAELPNVALRSFGAKTFYNLGPTDANADYVWGSLVRTITPANTAVDGVFPGDIIQLRNVQIGGASTWTADHHTMVVREVAPASHRLCVWEQNSNNELYVTTAVVDLRYLQSGTLWVYRPTN